MDDAELLKALAEAVAKQRGYAGFFDWDEERQKDLGLLAAFEEGAARVGIVVTGGRLQEKDKDPPDAWFTNASTSVAAEFTEFVDQSLIEQRRRTGESQWRFWTQDEVKSKLLEIVCRKDHAGFGAGFKYWLVIHCDEPGLNPATIGPYLANLPAFKVRGIDRCFLLLSYEPCVQSYPVMEVVVERAA